MDYPSKDTLGLIEFALAEDIGTGDVTSTLLVPESAVLKVNVIAKESGILCGVPAFRQVYETIDKGISIDEFIHEGSRLYPGDIIAMVEGPARAVLEGERVALNLLCHLSGVASETNRFAEKLRGTNCKVLDTRKTTPCMRKLEKYAVIIGGGGNHRMGLWDMILIKENHISAAGGIKAALDRVYSNGNPKIPVEVEVKNIDELRIALDYPLDRIMLDNFDVTKVERAVEIRRESGVSIPFDASGSIGLENCREYAEAGIEFVSCGVLTHSVKALDISMVALEVL